MGSPDTSVIETVESIRAADKDNMLDRIKDLGKQVRDAWQIGRSATIPPAYSDVRSIVLAGMGGSAIGGGSAGDTGGGAGGGAIGRGPRDGPREGMRSPTDSVSGTGTARSSPSRWSTRRTSHAVRASHTVDCVT